MRRRRGAPAHQHGHDRARARQRTLTTDSPFAETREQLGGYSLLDCADLDDAIGWAARIPDASSGSVEVRPVMDYEGTASRTKRGRPRRS